MESIEYFTYILIPIFIVAILLFGINKKIKTYNLFVEGVLEGCKTTLKIFPTILAIIVAITIFRESGALNLLIKCLSPINTVLKIPD